LNTKTYEASGFTKEGIKHHDMYFPDGSVPNNTIIDRFLETVEN
jgi:cell division cycle 14